jgi:predicted ATPase/DNA-binding winged helix-turn-helix (wHTH) protein
MIDKENPETDEVISFGPFRLFGARRLLERAGTPLHLGARAFDILIVLAEHAGKVVSKNDLMARVWPDVTIDEGSLRVHVAALRRTLGDGESGARYVTTLSGRGYCFVAPISRSNALSVPPTQNSASHHAQKLPTRLTRMVGRDEAVRGISAQLAAGRFVTVAGPGGIGKTTVAVAVGHALLADFAGAVCFFDLGPLNDPLLVASAVASALGLSVQSSDPTRAVVNFLRDRRMLLIFDSCEHVIETAAVLAEHIFEEAPQVHILATSRESLRVEGEIVHRLSPLGHPPDDTDLTAAQALDFPAVQLFVERVAASGLHFELNDADAPVVGEICRRLDGIALAIELAAGRVNACSIQETMAQLNDRFKLLWEGRRTALPRHQTLSATLDWSYDLLSELERLILRRLSVFAGIFTLEGARSVAVGDDLDDGQVVTAIASLIRKSLVAVDGGDQTTRYRLLDTTRAYGVGKLVESGELDPIKRRHANYYRELLGRIDLRSSAGSEVKGFSMYVEHLDNVRAGLEFSFSERGDIRTGIALAAASARLFLELSLLTECHRWTERAIAAFDESDRGSPCEMELQAALGLSLMFTKGNSDEARNSLLRGLTLAEDLGDLRNQLRLLGKLHVFYQRIGDCRNAFILAQRSETVAASIGDPASIAMANWSLGFSNYFAGNNISAEANWEASLMRHDSSRTYANNFAFDRDTHARTRCGLAAVRWLRGFPDQAIKIARDTIEEGATLRDPSTFCICLIFVGFTFLRAGNWPEAAETIDRLVTHAGKHSLAPNEATGLGMRGTLLIDRGEAQAGIELVRGAIETLQADRYELHSPVFRAALAEGLAMTGQFDKALTGIDEAIARIELNGQLISLPEFLRIKGTILASTPQADLHQAEDLFLRSLKLAGQQSTLAWELRAATSTARLRISQDRFDEAWGVLAPVYDRFTEGFESSDLKAAKALLDRLRSIDRP